MQIEAGDLNEIKMKNVFYSYTTVDVELTLHLATLTPESGTL